MQQLGFIMRGLAIAYNLQTHALESKHTSVNPLNKEETRNLLSLLNGDHLWNNYIKKQNQGRKYHAKDDKKGGQKGVKRRREGAPPAFNIMDVKQLLSFTKDRLEFFASQHADQLPEQEKEPFDVIRHDPNGGLPSHLG